MGIRRHFSGDESFPDPPGEGEREGSGNGCGYGSVADSDGGGNDGRDVVVVGYENDRGDAVDRAKSKL